MIPPPPPPPPPNSLLEMQSWFGDKLEQSVFDGSCASHFILDGPKLLAKERLQIYHQLYWWRIQNSLRSKYPMVVALIGDTEFYTISSSYLNQNPPSNWSLYHVYEEFPEWLETHCHHADKDWILDAARLDRAFLNTFVAPEWPKKMGSIFVLQPFVQLFCFSYPLLTFRQNLFEGKSEKPIKNGTYPYLISRTSWQLLDLNAYYLLSLFQTPKPLEEAFDALDEELIETVIASSTTIFS